MELFSLIRVAAVRAKRFSLKPITVHNDSGSYWFRSKISSGSYQGLLGPGPSWPRAQAQGCWPLGARTQGFPWGPGPVGPLGPGPKGSPGAQARLAPRGPGPRVPLEPGPSWPLGARAQGALGAHRIKHFALIALNISHQIFRIKHFVSNLSP